MRYQLTAHTLLGAVFKTGTFKTLKAARRAQDRWDLEYGAILRYLIVEVPNE